METVPIWPQIHLNSIAFINSLINNYKEGRVILFFEGNCLCVNLMSTTTRFQLYKPLNNCTQIDIYLFIYLFIYFLFYRFFFITGLDLNNSFLFCFRNPGA